jgi:hypothetical protein
MAKRRERRKRNAPKQAKIVTDISFNRIRPIMEDLMGIEDPDDLMIQITNVLDQTDNFPRPGKFYVFMYFAKTPNIVYDIHPLVAVTDVFEWGFRGLNFHWGTIRQYTWAEVFSPFYVVYDEELRDLESIPFQKFKLNS